MDTKLVPKKKFYLAQFSMFFIAFLFARCYEWVGMSVYHGFNTIGLDYVLMALVHDLQICVVLTVLFLLLAIPLQLIYRQEAVQNITAHLTVIVTMIYIFLISYFTITLRPLGADFWGYSITEIFNTVLATNYITVWSVLFLVMSYLMLYWLVRTIQSLEVFAKVKAKGVGAGVVAILVIYIVSVAFEADRDVNVIQKEKQENKLSYFATRSFSAIGLFGDKVTAFEKNEYPLLREAEQKDVLGPFFNKFNTPPNIVFLFVESMGGEFMGPNGQWAGFTPYLDSLSKESLYWENGLSLSGRTFGLVPSVLGSLPFGKHGFMELGPSYPNHQSLISLLDQRGYYTAFYSGYDTYFDKLDFFLDYQGIDYVLNKQKLEKLFPESTKSSNYWGVDDKTMFSLSSTLLDTAKAFPRLEIYHTLQSHSPFTVPNAGKYEAQFRDRLNKLDVSKERKKGYRQYRAELTTLLFADQSIKQFMESYRQRDQFENTIFIITGDHWLVPIPQPSVISRYHVPIMIYSPKLKRTGHFKSVNTHAEIVPTFTALLRSQTKLEMPQSVHWIGGIMDTSRKFRSRQSVPLMRNKNRISDYLDGEYYLYDDQLYKLGEGLTLTHKENKKVKARLEEKLSRFKSINQFVIESNRLYPGDSKAVGPEYTFLEEYDTLFAQLDKQGLSIDQQYQEARQMAFTGNYGKARAIAKRILMNHPGYHDVRILIGRTHAWEENYSEARKHFKEVLKSDSTYYDTYSAYFDNEYWAGNYEDALEVVNQGLKYHPQRKQFLKRKIKVLAGLKRYSEAKEVYNRFKKQISPADSSLKEFENIGLYK
ncbi:Phosphoglycerol transferase MdoB [Fodinibius salinus]|uniref:Phosphoglycerol transferase MdoB n=1 Tax=Fodinibius salinus TaxID=860790 RepID=A0A5D3YKC2_9BACT|nr:sulfatase-like hydrolase/transferase [Fodinibius salinus]TYP93406.1 Phosphoglycerol transferase MdoB [Fodinibius salinus]